MKRTLKKGGYSAVLTLIVIAAAVVFNMMINKLRMKNSIHLVPKNQNQKSVGFCI